MPVTLSPFALTDLATTKEHLGIPPSNVQFDDLVKRFINEATGRIEIYCDRKFKERTGIIEILDGFANDRLLFDQWPVTNLSEVWVDPTGDFTDIAYKLDSTDYALDKSARGDSLGLVLRNGHIFPRGIKNIKLVYDAGYATIPDELAGACIWTVQYLYDMRTERTIGIESKGKNQENTVYRGELPEFVTSTLQSYKRSEWPTGDRALSTR